MQMSVLCSAFYAKCVISKVGGGGQHLVLALLVRDSCCCNMLRLSRALQQLFTRSHLGSKLCGKNVVSVGTSQSRTPTKLQYEAHGHTAAWIK